MPHKIFWMDYSGPMPHQQPLVCVNHLSVGGYYIYIGLNCSTANPLCWNSPLLRAAVLFFSLTEAQELSVQLLGNCPFRSKHLERQYLFSHCRLLTQESFPSGFSKIALLVFLGERNWSAVRKRCGAYLCWEAKECPGNNTRATLSTGKQSEHSKEPRSRWPGYVLMTILQRKGHKGPLPESLSKQSGMLMFWPRILNKKNTKPETKSSELSITNTDLHGELAQLVLW